MPKYQGYQSYDEPSDFVMSFVEDSRREREDMEDIWDQVEDNFLVRPPQGTGMYTATKYPALTDPQYFGTSSGHAILKDPETHVEVTTIISNVALNIFPETGKSLVRAKRVGFEDILRAQVAQAICERISRTGHNFLEVVKWLMSTGIYGKGILECFWDYQEEPRVVRQLQVDPTTLMEDSSFFVDPHAVVFDDVRLEQFSVRDFYPDHGHTSIDRMCGAARCFQVKDYDIEARIAQGIYDKEQGMEVLRNRGGNEDKEHRSDNQADIDPVTESHPAFGPQRAIRYIGRVPISYPDGIDRREIVVVGGRTLRDEPWGRRSPWFDCQIEARLGSFWGISPAELVMFDQDFLDTLKMMLADAVVRVVHPPHTYDKDRDVDLAKLRRWSPKVPIGVSGDPNTAIGQPPYNPDIRSTSALYGMISQQMRSASTSLDSLQGQAGPDREAATVGTLRYQQAKSRPELFSRVVEQEYLPPLGKYWIELYREFADTEMLRERIGASNMTATLADIMVDFDLEFIGSRSEGTRQEELAALREIIAAAGNPVIAQQVPWTLVLQRHFQNLGAYDIAAAVGNPDVVQLNAVLNRIGGPPKQTGNGASNPAPAPIGAPQAQLAGQVVA